MNQRNVKLTESNHRLLARAERRTGKPAEAIVQAAVMTALAGHALTGDNPSDTASSGYWWECAWHTGFFGRTAYFTDNHEPHASPPAGKVADSHGLCRHCFDLLVTGGSAVKQDTTPHHD